MADMAGVADTAARHGRHKTAGAKAPSQHSLPSQLVQIHNLAAQPPPSHPWPGAKAAT